MQTAANMNNNSSSLNSNQNIDKIKESPDSTRKSDDCVTQQKESKVVKVPRFSPKTVKIIEIVALVIALCATVVLFSTPIVFHYVSEYTEFTANMDSTHPGDPYSSNHSRPNENSTTPCSKYDMTWSKLTLNSNGHCNVYQYTGSICGDVLYNWHLCAVESGDIKINNSITSQDILENDIQELDNLLATYSFTECQEQAIPFICQYYFPLRDCTSDNIYTASKDDCIRISTTVCAAPWNLAVTIGYGHRLPKCDALPYAHRESLNKTTFNDTAAGVNNTITGEDFNITCREDFYELNNTCFPRCDKFKENPHTASVTMVVSEQVAVSIGIVVCLIILVLSLISYKTLLSFPSVLIFFMMLDYLVAAITVIIAASDRSELFCSSISLKESLDNPTAFCAVSGAIFHYAIVNMTLWWFFHLCIFLYKVIAPFHAKRTQTLGRQKYIFGIIVLLGLGIPLPAVIVSLSTDKHKYFIARFPPSVCNPDGEMWFYSTTLLITILLGAGVCFLVIIFFIIHRNQGFRASNQEKVRLSTAEKKILIVFISFLIFGVYTMVHVAIVTSNADETVDGFLTYFACEASGHVPGKCDRTIFEQYTQPYMSAVAYILMGLVPFSILNFVVKWKAVKALFKRFTAERLHSTSSTKSSLVRLNSRKTEMSLVRLDSRRSEMSLVRLDSRKSEMSLMTPPVSPTVV